MRGRARVAMAAIAAAAMSGMLAVSCAPARARGLFVVDGAWLSPREIDAYCGGRSTGATCATPACAPSDAIDPRSGACVSQRAVRAIVARDRPTPIPEGFVAACRDDHVLVAHDDHALCLARADACPRTTHADASRGCVADAACPAGEIRAREGCVRVVTNGVLDVGRWSRAVLGADGGEGDARLCRVLAQAPWDFDVGAGGSRTITLAIDLRFPDNDATQVTATATPTPTPTPTASAPASASAPATASASASLPLPSAALLDTQTALDALLIPLRALSATGATPDAASAAVRVTCTLRGTSSPLLLPP